MTAATWITAFATVVTAVVAGLIYWKQPRGASLSVRYEKRPFFVQREIQIFSEVFVLTNLGPDPAQVVSIEVLDEPRLMAGPLGLDDLHLMKDEQHRILATPDLSTPPTVRIRMVWIDSRGEQSRDQTINMF